MVLFKNHPFSGDLKVVNKKMIKEKSSSFDLLLPERNSKKNLKFKLKSAAIHGGGKCTGCPRTPSLSKLIRSYSPLCICLLPFCHKNQPPFQFFAKAVHANVIYLHLLVSLIRANKINFTTAIVKLWANQISSVFFFRVDSYSEQFEGDSKDEYDMANENPLFMSFKNKIHFMKIDNNERKSCDAFSKKAKNCFAKEIHLLV